MLNWICGGFFSLPTWPDPDVPQVVAMCLPHPVDSIGSIVKTIVNPPPTGANKTGLRTASLDESGRRTGDRFRVMDCQSTTIQERGHVDLIHSKVSGELMPLLLYIRAYEPPKMSRA